MVYKIPTIGDLVIVRVEKISQSRGAECSILAIERKAETDVLGESLRGTVRSVDIVPAVLQTEFTDIGDCFRPADILRAKVISLGDSKGYFLSTVSDNCGVLCGDFSESRPISYKLIAKVDGSVERRKVARP